MRKRRYGISGCKRKMDEMVPKPAMPAPDTDVIRMSVNGALDPGRKSALGQFMTPSPIARFMATLFDDPVRPSALLDPGAGIGSLSVAAVPRIWPVASVDAWEIDPLMRRHLEQSLRLLGVEHRIHADDFIMSAVQQIALANGRRYTHAILNPPYKKLNSDSDHRALLRKVGIETVNLYAAFVALSVLLMEDLGQVVAILPRSFCNGPYYKPFRQLILDKCSLDRIHVFESRARVFKDDDVLQENVIIKLVKAKRQGCVVVSSSHDQMLTDYREGAFPFAEIVEPTDPESFIHVPTEAPEARNGSYPFHHSLDQIGVEVCTGPVVDFRLRHTGWQIPLPTQFRCCTPTTSQAVDYSFRSDTKNPMPLKTARTFGGGSCRTSATSWSSAFHPKRRGAELWPTCTIRPMFPANGSPSRTTGTSSTLINTASIPMWPTGWPAS
jgi:adenine-specific DNA-methyltransferase